MKDMVMIINNDKDLMFTEIKTFNVNSEKRRILFEQFQRETQSLRAQIKGACKKKNKVPKSLLE